MRGIMQKEKHVQSTNNTVKRISLSNFCDKYGVSIMDDGYTWNEADAIASGKTQDGSSSFRSDSSTDINMEDAADTDLDGKSANETEDSSSTISKASVDAANKLLLEVSYDEALDYLTESDQKMIHQFFDDTDDIVITVSDRDEEGMFLEYEIAYIDRDRKVYLNTEKGGINSSGSSFFSPNISDKFSVKIGGHEWLGLRLENGELHMISFQSNRKIEFYFENYEDKDIVNFLSH